MRILVRPPLQGEQTSDLVGVCPEDGARVASAWRRVEEPAVPGTHVLHPTLRIVMTADSLPHLAIPCAFLRGALRVDRPKVQVRTPDEHVQPVNALVQKICRVVQTHDGD